MAGRTAYPPAADRPPRACPCDLAPVRRQGRPSSELGHRPAGTALKTYEKENPPYCYRCLPDAGRLCRRTCGASSTSACLANGDGRVESPPDKKLLSSSATYGVRSADAMTVAAVRWLSGDLCAQPAPQDTGCASLYSLRPQALEKRIPLRTLLSLYGVGYGQRAAPRGERPVAHHGCTSAIHNCLSG